MALPQLVRRGPGGPGAARGALCQGDLPSPLNVMPGPWGHSWSNSAEPCCGHCWQGVPQPEGCPKMTVQQQQLDRVTGSVLGPEHTPSRYDEKHRSRRVSDVSTAQRLHVRHTGPHS